MLGLILGVIMATVSTFQGPISWVGIPDSRFSPANLTLAEPSGGGAADAATYTEADLELDVTPASTNLADPNGMPGAEPRASGTPSSSSLALTAATVYPGSVDGVGTYSLSDGTNTYYQSSLYTITGGETIRAALSSQGYRKPRARALPNGNLMVVYENWVDDTIDVQTWTASTKTWGTAVTVSDLSATSFSTRQALSPELITVKSDTASGRILYAGWLEQEDASIATGNLRLMLSYSSDLGATWSTALQTNLALAYNATDTYSQLRMTWDELSGQIVATVLFNDNGTYSSLLWVSNDFGASWAPLTGSGTIANIVQHDLTSYCGTIYLATIASGAGTIPVYRRTAADPGWAAWVSDATGDRSTTDDYAVVVDIDPSGRFFVGFRYGIDALVMVSSADNGATWDSDIPTIATPNILVDNTAGTLTSGIIYNSLVYLNGQVRYLGTLISVVKSDYSLYEVTTGGRSTVSTVTAPLAADGYYPTDTPQTKSANFVYAGGSAESITTAANGRIIYRVDNTLGAGYNTVTGASTLGVSSRVAFSADSSSAAAIPAIEVAATDGVNQVRLQARIKFTAPRTIQMYDAVAGANVGGVVALPSGDFEVYMDVMQSSSWSRGAAWVKALNSDVWVGVIAAQPLTTAAVATSYVRFGKLTATAAELNILYAFPGISLGLYNGFLAPLYRGFSAMTRPDHIPSSGLAIHWEGSPVRAGSSWLITPRAKYPMSRTSPLSCEPSPTLRWKGTAGASGLTWRSVYDFGSSYRGRLSGLGSVFSAWFNSPGLSSLVIRRWGGAAWSTIVTGSALQPWLSAGSTSFRRANVASYQIRPGTTSNINCPVWKHNELRGWWCDVSDGTDAIGGIILWNDAGQFTAGTGEYGASFEFDPATVVTTAGAGFGAIATSTTTGTIKFYSPNGMTIGFQDNEAVRYYAFEGTLATGATIPTAGIITAGIAYPLARSARDGSSVRFLSPTEIRQQEGAGFKLGRRVKRKGGRIYELPFDSQIVHSEYYNPTATGMNTISIDGSRALATIDNNPSIIEALSEIGQAYPLVWAIDAKMTVDPTSAPTNVLGDDCVYGWLGNGGSSDRVASTGFLRPRSGGSNLAGTSLVIEEEV